MKASTRSTPESSIPPVSSVRLGKTFSEHSRGNVAGSSARIHISTSVLTHGPDSTADNSVAGRAPAQVSKLPVAPVSLRGPSSSATSSERPNCKSDYPKGTVTGSSEPLSKAKCLATREAVDIKDSSTSAASPARLSTPSSVAGESTRPSVTAMLSNIPTSQGHGAPVESDTSKPISDLTRRLEDWNNVTASTAKSSGAFSSVCKGEEEKLKQHTQDICRYRATAISIGRKNKN